jgi:hypothetical protein
LNRAHQSLLRVGRTVERDFHGAVGAISDPPGDAQPVRGLPHIPPESYTLNAATNAEVERRHPSNLALHSEKCGQRRGNPRGECGDVVPDRHIPRYNELPGPNARCNRLERVRDGA